MRNLTTLYENPINGERWVCDNAHQTKLIDGEVYLYVRKPNESRKVFMRKSSLRKLPNKS